MAEEVVALAMSLIASFAVAVLYFTFRRGLSPVLATVAAALVLLGAPLGLALFGKYAPLFSATYGLLVAVLADIFSCLRSRG